ncbi:MAG: histidinol-phosphatase HisJ family protein [Chloroflexota bacterium]|nr:histidinol-phosphatase HisJ family protein [Chloroflexota bacterium]
MTRLRCQSGGREVSLPGSLHDYHVHTYLCGHAIGSAEEYVLAAIAAGLDEIGFAEHVPLYWLPVRERDPEIAMPEERFEEYVRTVLDLRASYPEIRILIGVEADYIPGFEEALDSLLAPYPWDYVYGSVHYVDGWGFDNPAYAGSYSEWDVTELYARYFELVCAAARTGLFDIIGHLDVIKKWGHKPPVVPEKLYRSVAAELSRCNVVVEANTAGYRKPVGELYPSAPLLRCLLDAGIELSLGSDAHAPGEVGSGFERALAELRQAGCASLVRFERRNRTYVPLPKAR